MGGILAGTAIGATVGTAGTAGASFLLGKIGFTLGGVAAGSMAAATQAGIGNVAAGSLFAWLQAAGATGAVMSAMPAVAGTTTVIGTVIGVAKWIIPFI